MKPFRSFINENYLIPGLLKCVFLAGGPGSGKSTVAADVFGLATHSEKVFSMFGMTITSSDIIYERMLHERGVDLRTLSDIEHRHPDEWKALDAVRKLAKMEVNANRATILASRAGIIYDGTGDDYNEKASQKADADHYGYDTYMIFVQTPLEVSLARNAERERKLPDDIVNRIWLNSETNRPRFRALFGEHYYEVEGGNTLKDDTRRYFMTALREPIQNPKGKTWLESRNYTKLE